jgi:hypothetical protein
VSIAEAQDIEKIPRRITVAGIVSSRYENDERPLSWERRVAGVDIVRTASGKTLRLYSEAMQSPPKSGWTLLLTAMHENESYTWTLYGIK